MIKKEERKKQKTDQKKQEKGEKNLKQADKQEKKAGPIKKTKENPITKQKLETLPTIASMLATPVEERESKAAHILPSVLPFIIEYINKK